jgi:hypothetical protein
MGLDRYDRQEQPDRIVFISYGGDTKKDKAMNRAAENIISFYLKEAFRLQ